MIRHIVLFRVKERVSPEFIRQAFDRLFLLQNQIVGILNISGGKCHFHQGKGKGYITHGFSIDFVHAEAYSAFLHDPVTHPAKQGIINIAENGYEGLFGFDLGNPHNIFPNPLDKHRTPTPRLVPRGAIR